MILEDLKLKTVKGANDYDSMREILTRRFQHGLDEVKAIEERNLALSSGKFCVFPRSYINGWWTWPSERSFGSFE